MVSKKLLLITFAVLSCAANSSLAMDQELQELPNPDRYAQNAFNAEAAGKRGKRKQKELFVSHARREFGPLYKNDGRNDILRNLRDAFDAAYKKIENDRYKKTKAAHLAACPAEDIVRPVLKLRKTIGRQVRSRSL